MCWVAVTVADIVLGTEDAEINKIMFFSKWILYSSGMAASKQIKLGLWSSIKRAMKIKQGKETENGGMWAWGGGYFRSVVREGSLQSDIWVETMSEWQWPCEDLGEEYSQHRWQVERPQGRRELGEFQKHQENQSVEGRMSKMGGGAEDQEG